MREAITTPFDVRLMNTIAGLLFLVFGLLVLATLAGWVGNHALFAIRAISVQGDVSHCFLPSTKTSTRRCRPAPLLMPRMSPSPTRA